MTDNLVDLTFDRAAALLDEIVAAKGADYVYDDSCMYYLDDEDQTDYVPSCIVGHLFDRLDPEHTGRVSEIVLRHNDTGIEDLNLRTRLGLPDEVVPFLQRVQTAQDQRIPWGKAVEYAKSQGTRPIDPVEGEAFAAGRLP